MPDVPPVSRHYGILPASVEPLGSGLINLTFLVTAAGGERYVLQRLNPVFPAAINRDIDVVTRHLRERGLTTPVLLPTQDGALWVDWEDHAWRLMTYVPGLVHQRLERPRQAAAAGRLLGRFHRALADLEHRFANPRLGVHDTARHLRKLARSLEEGSGHRDHARIAPVAERILERAASLPGLPATPDRVVHGDPKINNFVFDPGEREALCLVDLDTLGRMPLPLELGDALRSWCNPAGEDRSAARFDGALFEAALAGYAEAAGDWLTPDEAAAVLPATRTIVLELAARFCADAYEERYFGWDPRRYGSRSEHNLVRARGQLALADSLEGALPGLARIADRALGAGAG